MRRGLIPVLNETGREGRREREGEGEGERESDSKRDG
jgi:hypothetical protein